MFWEVLLTKQNQLTLLNLPYIYVGTNARKLQVLETDFRTGSQVSLISN